MSPKMPILILTILWLRRRRTAIKTLVLCTSVKLLKWIVCFSTFFFLDSACVSWPDYTLYYLVSKKCFHIPVLKGERVYVHFPNFESQLEAKEPETFNVWKETFNVCLRAVCAKNACFYWWNQTIPALQLCINNYFICNLLRDYLASLSKTRSLHFYSFEFHQICLTYIKKNVCSDLQEELCNI